MRAYSLKKAKEMVRIYNETKSIDKVSERLELPRLDVKQIMLWLHAHDPANQKQEGVAKPFTLAMPLAPIWAQFLYAHNAPAHTAAAAVNWPLQKLLESCGGPEEWEKRDGRKPLTLHDNNIYAKGRDHERRDADPDAAEIEARKREIHAAWDQCNSSFRGGVPKEPRRVEVRSYVYDNRNGTFAPD